MCLTAIRKRLVIVEVVDSNSAAPEQLRPVHSVVVTKVGILTDVHAAVVDVPQRAQPEGGKSGDTHHHQRESPFFLVWGLEDTHRMWLAYKTSQRKTTVRKFVFQAF